MHRSSAGIKLSILAGLLLIGHAVYAAQPQTPADFPIVPMVDQAPNLDGDLSDPAWQQALVLKLETPVLGEKPKDKAEVRVVSDAENFYFGFSCEESHPQGPWIDNDNDSEEAEKVVRSDCVSVAIDMGYWGLFNYYNIYADASGRSYAMAQWFIHDSIFTEPYVKHKAAAKTQGKSWAVELKVPFKDMLADRAAGMPKIAGLNFRRVQWGGDRGSYKNIKDALYYTWGGAVDSEDYRVEKHFRHMIAWQSINYGEINKWAQAIHPTEFGHVRIAAGKVDNKLTSSADKDRLREFWDMGSGRFLFPSLLEAPKPRMPRRDDLRPASFPKIETKVVYTEPPNPDATAFTGTPSIAKTPKGYDISFAVTKPTDVAVEIVGADGRTVRYLAAGMLGENAPGPLKPGLTQRIAWDGLDDHGQKVASGCKLLIAHSLKAVDDGFINVAIRDRDKPFIDTHLDVASLPNKKFDRDKFDKTDHTNGGGNLIALDPETDEILYGGTGDVFDARTGKPIRKFTFKTPGISNQNEHFNMTGNGEAVFGPNKFMYVHGWHGIYKFTTEGKLGNFEASENVLIPDLSDGHTNPHRGIAVGGPDSDIYLLYTFLNHGATSGQVSRFGRDGRIKDYGIVESFQGTMAGVKIDREGNIYVGSTVRPKDFPLPRELSGMAQGVRDSYQLFYGAVIKFTPKGGRLSWDSGDLLAGGKTHSGGKLTDANFEGAVWARPGLSPMLARVSAKAGGPKCTCRQARFGMDGFARLYIPDAIQGFVDAVDSNGNTLLRIGGRGNTASKVKLTWPTIVEAGNGYVYVLDERQSKIHRIKLAYAASQELLLP